MSHHEDNHHPPSSSLSIQAIQILLDYDPALLEIPEIGRLTSCSKGMSNSVEGARLWEKIFQRVAKAGETYQPRFSNGMMNYNNERETWTGEKGLLGCFSNPSRAVIDKIGDGGGYRRAVACLLSKSCNRCGRLAGRANPITMERLCKLCYKQDEANFIISKSKAKEVFLLSEKDVQQLKVNAEIPLNNFLGRDVTATVFLFSEVKDAAFGKHGGVEGLSEEIRKRQQAAADRFRKSQDTSKPQKKRSKIERLSCRPADVPSKLDFTCCSGIPIGTVYDSRQMKMAHSVKCNKCSVVQGTIDDICMHEKLEHNHVTNFHFATDQEPTSTQSFANLTPLSEMPGVTDEWVRLFLNASVEHISMNDHYETRKVAILTFGDSDVKVSVDYIRVDDYHTSLYDANVQVCFQEFSSQKPRKLLNLAWIGHGMLDVMEDEFMLHHIEALAKALEVPVGDPVQLMALFVSRVLTRNEANGIFSEIEEHARDDEYEFSENPFFRGVWELLVSEH